MARLSLNAHGPITSLQKKKKFKKPYNNQLTDLESSVRLGLGLRFSLKVLTLGYEVAGNNPQVCTIEDEG